MSIHGPINPPTDGDDDEWGSFSDVDADTDENLQPAAPAPLAEYNNDTPEPTITALQDAVNAFAKQAGYAVARHQGRKKKGTNDYVRYGFYCTRGGEERPSKAIVRSTTTIKTGCKYQCIARLNPEGSWRWEQHPDAEKRVHNHEPALDPSAFRQHRQMKSPEKRVVMDLSSHYAIKTREMSRILQNKFPGSSFTKKDVDNQRAYLRAAEMDGNSAAGAVIKAFDEEGITYEAFWDDPEAKTVLQGIVFSFPAAEEKWKRFGNCLGADNTYKTNALGFPLMVVTTMTNVNTIAAVAFALMKDETLASFTALFNGLEKIRARIDAPKPHVVITDKDEQQKAALNEVWPDAQQQLCRFHINQNVLLRAKQKWVKPDGAEEDEAREDTEEDAGQKARARQQSGEA